MVALALLTLVIWLYLLLGRGFFWRAREEETPLLRFAATRAKGAWPRIVAVVPARNEASVIGETIPSLLAQDYPGELSVVLVDDQSEDGTAEIARAAAVAQGGRLDIVAARPLPQGWTGKLWALSEGVRQIATPPDLYLFTDADIVHHRSNLAELVARLEEERRDLVSLMVKLRCQSFAERFLIPPFVFFFALLYPFAWSNDPRKSTAAAAGGCVLIRRSAYERIGGYAAIKGELIDDCALAAAVKRGGSIWLGLTQDTVSLRPYPRIADIWAMVARTAYTQLQYSPALLVATVLGMIVTYLLPPLLLFAGGTAAVLGLLAWALMTLAYLPMVRFYNLSLLWSPLLPAAALVYVAATVDSAYRHWRGRGGAWKGRVQWQSRS